MGVYKCIVGIRTPPKYAGHPNIWEVSKHTGCIQTCEDVKYAGGIQTCGGIQTYRGHPTKWVLPLVLIKSVIFMEISPQDLVVNLTITICPPTADILPPNTIDCQDFYGNCESKMVNWSILQMAKNASVRVFALHEITLMAVMIAYAGMYTSFHIVTCLLIFMFYTSLYIHAYLKAIPYITMYTMPCCLLILHT